MIRAVLFDLDGTLADTAPDLGLALNLLREEEGLPALPHDVIRPVASHGARGLLQLGFELGPEDARFVSLRDRFLAHYTAHICDGTQLFPGMAEVLQYLVHRQMPWGIVTNKPARFTDPLLARLVMPCRPGVVVSGDTVGVAKPDPRPMRFACEQIGVNPEHCLYIGDAERDIEAGRAVGMSTAIAEWGYLSLADRPETWGADYHLTQPASIPSILQI